MFSVIVVCPFPYEYTIAYRHIKTLKPTTSNATPKEREGKAPLQCGFLPWGTEELYHG